MIIIHARFQVNAAKEEAFLAQIRSLVEGSRAEAGNISYDLMKDTEQEQVYTMVEVWKDAEAVALHNTSSHFTAFVGQASEFLTAPLEVSSYEASPLAK
ncbi:putative quinol monooxygenase [Domibacillus robiginosus]|uniref:putative quinol monooxygenase n=1 Tax=Domibacillus robiginosus TaxID=1071054 RepID=UPI00067C9346|nr:putative quinol monooxygenase [Domibacillus robiginosus]